MSTKRLARTIVEGGKRPGATENHRMNTKAERHLITQYCNQARYDEDLELPEFNEPHVYREFNDRLAPLYSYVKRQVGRPWDDVYSDIRRDNDIRTMKGWHIIDHAKKLIDNRMHGIYRYSFGFYRDDDGILREYERYSPRYRFSKEDRQQIASIIAWANGNIVLRIGNQLIWHEPIRKYRLITWASNSLREEYYHEGFRSAGIVTREQREYLYSLPTHVRNRVFENFESQFELSKKHRRK